MTDESAAGTSSTSTATIITRPRRPLGAPALAALGACLRGCHALQRADAVAADLTASSELRNLLQTFELQHAQLAFDLGACLEAGVGSSLGKNAATGSEAQARRGAGGAASAEVDASALWMVREPSATTVLEHCLRSEFALLQNYRRALALGLNDAALVALLERQTATVQAMCGSLRARLREGLADEAAQGV